MAAGKGSAILIGLGAPPMKGKGAKDDKDDGDEVDIEEGDEGTEALAGKELAKAIKAGDGQRIYDVIEKMIKECVDKSESSEKDDPKMDDESDE